MAGYTRADTVNNIADGNVINASDLDNEFDTLQTAFNEVAGHVHDGSSAQGAPITRVGPAQDVIVSGTAVLPKTDNTLDLGSDTYEFKDAYINGTAYIDTLEINGTVVTSTAAELNILDGVTATAAEINTLDGITASTAELNILDGVTATAAEINLLDGVTATTTEINYIDGVTSAIQTQLDNKQPLDAQLTDVAGLTPGDGNFIVGNGTNFVAESGATARASLGLTIGTDVQAYDAELAALAGVTSAANKLPYFTGSGTAAVTDLSSFGRTLIDDADAATARSTLGLVIGTNVQAYDQQLADVAGLTPTDGNFIVGDGTNFVAESGATARTSLGLGSIATQASSNVTITGGSITGITDLAIADGGTGASTANDGLNNLLPSQASATGKYLKSDGTNTSWDTLEINTSDITGTLPIANGGTNATTASGARTSLGLVIGTDVQAYDAQLADVAGLTPTDNGVIIGNGSNFVVESGATLKTSLGLTIGTDVQAYDADTAKYDDATANFVGTLQNGGSNVVVDSDIGSTVQAYDSNLSSFVSTFTLPTTDGTSGQVIQTNGSGTLSFTAIDADPAGTAVALAIALG